MAMTHAALAKKVRELLPKVKTVARDTLLSDLPITPQTFQFLTLAEDLAKAFLELVEDNEKMRRVISDILKYGYGSPEFRQQAREALAERKPNG